MKLNFERLTENITKVIHKFQDSILSEVACGCGF
jgi:hypothetical protein